MKRCSRRRGGRLGRRAAREGVGRKHRSLLQRGARHHDDAAQEARRAGADRDRRRRRLSAVRRPHPQPAAAAHALLRRCVLRPGGFVLIAVSYVLVRQVLIHNPGEFLGHVAEHLGLSPVFLVAHARSVGRAGDRGHLHAHGAGSGRVATAARSYVPCLHSPGRGGRRVGRASVGSLPAACCARCRRSRAPPGTPRRAPARAHRHAGPERRARELADTFDAMLGRLEAAFEAQQQFVSNASHELRTPLAIMRTEVEVTLADPTSSAGSCGHAGGRAGRRPQPGGSLRPCSPWPAPARRRPAEQAVGHRPPRRLGSTDRLAARRRTRLELTLDLSLESAPVRGDATLLERLVENLVQNALQYNVPHGWVSVATRTDGDTASLRVANSGPPVPTEAVAGLFERFRRLDEWDHHQGAPGLRARPLDRGRGRPRPRGHRDPPRPNPTAGCWWSWSCRPPRCHARWRWPEPERRGRVGPGRARGRGRRRPSRGRRRG